jgi:hypothetical protein
MILSKLLYQRCLTGGKFNWDFLRQQKAIMRQGCVLTHEDPRWRLAIKAIKPFLKEAGSAGPEIQVLPIHCVNRCPSGDLLFRLGLNRNPFVLLGFSEGKYLLGDLSASKCSQKPQLQPVIYGFDGMLIWDLYQDLETSALALIYRKKSVLTGGGGALPA